MKNDDECGALTEAWIREIIDEVYLSGVNRVFYIVLGPPHFVPPYDCYKHEITPSTIYDGYVLYRTSSKKGNSTAVFRPGRLFDNYWNLHKFRCKVGYANTRFND